MSERREPSWVDYGNLAANLVQVGQLSAVQGRLKQLAEIEAAREERIQLINGLRQIVFESEEGLLQLGKYITNAPTGVFIAVSLLKVAFDKIGIIPQTFEDFADKDRVKRVREIIQKRIDESSQRLSNEQLSEAQRMIELVPKLGDLDILINALDAKDELAKTDAEWKSLEEQRKISLQPWNTILFVSLIWLVFSCLFINTSSGGQNLDAFAALGILCVMYGIPIIGIITSIVKISKVPAQRFNELKKQRAALQKLLLPVEKYKSLISEFGDKTSEEYKSLRTNVMEYVERVTQKDENGKDLSAPLLSFVIPESVLNQGEAG